MQGAMMDKHFRGGRLARVVSSALVWLLILGQSWLPVYAQTVPPALSDIPIAAKVQAKPNIVYTLDDSGSMYLNYLPDYVSSAGSTSAITKITRVGTTATVQAAGAVISTLSVNDWVTIAGATQPEYNGYVQVVTIPDGTHFTYTLPSVPAVSPATVAPGYATIVLVNSSAYCRSGNNTTPCTPQAINIGQSTVTLTSVTRPAAGTAGGTLATATGTAASLAALNTGDTVLIQGGTGTSVAYNGSYQITKTSATTFTYIMTPTDVPLTPLAMAPTKQFVLVGTSFAAPPLHAADFNRLAYNPNVTYIAPLGSDGKPLTTTDTDGNGNYGSTAALYGAQSVHRDPYAAFEVTAGNAPVWSAATKDNLSLKVLVPLYCNTDWPKLVNDTVWTPGDARGATVLDAGDSNGQHMAGTGDWCRINGTQYDDSVASGAKGVQDDYNYPWRPSTGPTSADYFYQLVTTKTLYCDKTSPYYPRSTAIQSCNGGTANPGPAVPQTCNTQGKICNPTVASRTYNPSACSPSTPGWLAAEWCAGGTAPPGATGSGNECKACSCVADTNPVPAKRCSISGAACNVNSDCPDVSNTITSCTGGTPVYAQAAAQCWASSGQAYLMWDPVNNKPGTTSLLDDSNGDGVVCRHNNQAYAVGGVLPAVATYPRTNVNDVATANKTGIYASPNDQKGQFTTGVTSGCPPVGTTVAIPRHYYVIDSVKFCNDRDVTANDQWKGFGQGVCHDQNDLQQYKEVKYGKFTRVDLFATNSRTFAGTSKLAASASAFPNGRAWLAGANPGPDNSESINYANWYAYYSTRLLAAKTTSSIAFSYLTPGVGEQPQYRVGFHNLGEEPAGYGGAGKAIVWVDVKDWDQPQRDSWYNALFGISIPSSGGFKTPTIDAMLRIGNLFETGGSAGLPPEVNPLPATAADPIALDVNSNPISCQNNYHILFTDGATNQVSLPNAVGNQDKLIPGNANSLTTIATIPPDQVLGSPTNLVAGNAWPGPFVEGTTVDNTLADVAMRYWAYDLRPSLKNDVPAPSGKAAQDLDWTQDIAWWQHVNFSAISFGAAGTLDASSTAQQKATVGAIQAGTLSWPNLTNPNDPIYPRGAAAGAVAVDDLWHATVNSRGSFVSAKSPAEVSYGLANILAGIQNQRKSRAAAAFGSPVLDSNNDVFFEVTIEPGWAGDLQKVEVDPVTGLEAKTWWQASVQLAAQIKPASVGDEPWMDETKRRVVTLAVDPGTTDVSTGPGVPFRFSKLTNAQLASLANSATQQNKVIAYLRGGSTYGGAAIEGTDIGQFRKRFGALGDISDAQAAIVGPPDRGYQDATDPGYATYVATNKTRSTDIVVGANDGMVHVFDAGPVAPVADGGGNEVFAYIPKALFRGTAGNPATEDPTAIQALTYQDGGVPIFHHHMYVNATPRVADVDFGNGSGDWHTIVVGGLGKGGNSYYALDLTDPSATDESAAAGKVLWEWTDPTGDLKYSYARPVIVKVRETGYPTGRWVVIVTGGYNNVSGKGKIYILDAKTGKALRTITTSAGDAGNPSGLAQVHAFVKDRTNQIAEQIYGGDLFGNLWRVDVSKADDYLTAAPVLFAELKDGSNNGQPITTAPQIEIDISNGINRYVFIGTGRLLDVADFTDPAVPQQQTMYAIRDGTLDTPLTTGLPIQGNALPLINADRINAIVGGAPDGWRDDIPLSPTAERIVVDVEADDNIIVYTGTQAQTDPCVIALPATLYARDYLTGKSLVKKGGVVVAGYDLPAGAVGNPIVSRKTPDGTPSFAVPVPPETGGKMEVVELVNPVIGNGSRLSWRLLTGQ
jgi:type IV pilus assembly protein PilY1